MANSTVGTAYVQIVPSAQGIGGSISRALGRESDSAGTMAGKRITGKLKAAIGAAAIGTVVTAGIGKAISEGGKMEQSIGGIETLFKKSSDTMINYADQAYKTAGISANTYMEQATSFAASLLQSTGGNTAKAADAANQAVIDMSDNANKMGTSIEDIQNAYQGFAKQNYTMLDNLKLGYGGTKTEMERLLKDAEKISGQDYDISNLNDVYGAIHVIQEEMGITGTSAEEAASTLSGSFAAMKSAADNFLGNLALGRNIGPSMAALAETAATYLFGNLIPAIGNILRSLPEAMIAFVQSGIPRFMESGAALARSLAEGLQNTLSDTLATLPAMINFAFAKITLRLPNLLSQGIKLVENIVSGIVQGIPKLAASASKLISSFGNFIQKNYPVIMSKAGELIGRLAAGIIQNLPKIVAALAKLAVTMVKALVGMVPTMAKGGLNLIKGLAKGMGGAALSAVKSAMRKVINGISSPLKKAIGTIKGIVDTIRRHLSFSGLLAKVSSLFRNVKDKITAPIQKARELVKTAVDKIKGIFPLRLGKIFSGIKLPHFNISGGKIPWGIGGKGTKPNVSISWYKKGGVFEGPSVIGVGEAGREAVVPLSGKYMRPFAETIAKEMPHSSGTTYHIGDVKLEVSSLKDVATLEEIVTVFRRAKAYAR